MTALAPGASGAGVPRWLPWLFLLLLVVPFHPYWIDFEQVRRGLLLLLAGLTLLVSRSLVPVRSERYWLGLVGLLVLSACVNLMRDGHGADAEPSFRPWDAGFRTAHWLALLVVLRLGAAVPSAFSWPCACVLAATSLFGLLQRTGLGEIAGYGVEREPVSVFGNLNVASEWTAVAATAVAALGATAASGLRRWLPAASLVLAGAYLVVNQSRSGLIALPVGLLVLSVLRRRQQRGWLPLALAAVGAAIGCLLHLAAPRPGPADAAAAKAERDRGTATLAVRAEIAKSTLQLVGESPLLGHGPGQFAIEYPRVRSEYEIELSSGRQFATSVRTAHDDWLELLVDGGVPALLLFLAALWALQRGCADHTRLLPLFVLLLLMLVRAPLGNAPAAAIAFLFAGTQVEGAVAASRSRRLLAVGLGVVLCGLGLLPVAGNCLAASYQRTRAHGERSDVASLESAAALMPFEPALLQLLAQEQMFAGDLAAARKTAAAAVALRPFDPQLYELLAEVLVKGKAFDRADQLVRHALHIDPQHPELRMWLSWLLMQRGETDLAIAAVATEPHRVLRARLAEHFRALAEAARRSGREQDAARYSVEHHFLAAVDNLGQADRAARIATTEHVKALGDSIQTAGLRGTDLRFHVVSSLHLIVLGKPETAIAIGKDAQKSGLRLADWQRELIGSKLEPLLRLEPWREVLDAR
ncbi:MAG TPA: O-antigen ligase family protein [Planctomycetota bacterium]